MKDKTSKRYFWNSNAREHRVMIIAAFVMSNMLGMVSTMTPFLMVTRLVGCKGEYALAVGVIVVCAGWFIVWGLSFLAMTSTYYRLIESQVINGEGGKTIIEHRRMYQTEKGWKLYK